MALTELEQSLINTVIESQEQQAETIESLQKQVSSLTEQISKLSEAYNGIAQELLGPGPESS